MEYTPKLFTSVSSAILVHRKCIWFLMFVIPLRMALGGVDEQQTPGPKTNVGVMQFLSDSVAQEIVLQAHLSAGDSLDINITKGEDVWIFSEAVTSALKSMGIYVFTGRDSLTMGKILLTVHAFRNNVYYEDMTRDGLFGTKKVKRNVTVECSYEVQNVRTHELLTSASVSKRSRDTVAVDDIAHIEFEGARSTHGELPSENYLDKIVEPFIIIGVAGVAIYLFFHIRS